MRRLRCRRVNKKRFGMQTLPTVLGQAESNTVAIGQFNVSDLVSIGIVQLGRKSNTRCFRLIPDG
jgi:hypothetical protein